MMRIVFSRAAFFPWLGIALMAIGAMFPEGDTAGMIVLVIGANVAFFGLAHMSREFAWGAETRPMLNLCGLIFPLGLALILVSSQFVALNRCLAPLCTGMYLCLFAVWTSQQPVGLGYRVLAFVGVLLMLMGGVIGWLGWKERRLFAESDPEPQDMRLIDLQTNGHGSNRYIRLTDFRFCDQSVSADERKKSKIHDVWIPIVPVDGQIVKRDGPAPKVPARVESVVAVIELGDQSIIRRGDRTNDVLRRKMASEGYECTVSSSRELKPEVRERLGALAPETDFDRLLVLHWHKPASANLVYGLLGAGGAALLLGLLALLAMYRKARKVVSVPGWDDPEEPIPDQPATE